MDALLATDEDPLSEHDIAEEATWADRLRGANADGARTRTRQWHFVDIEISHPSITDACFSHPPLPAGLPASRGPARACLVDKVDQFTAELAGSATPPDERLLALKFLLHCVGDLHQPLHASDDDDRGGNDKLASAPGFRAGTLHHLWDTEFVGSLGSDPLQVARALLAASTPSDRRRWAAGTPAQWALDTFQLAKRDAYGRLPQPGPAASFRLGPAYLKAAQRDVRLQLLKAGIRLAAVLNRALDPRSEPSSRSTPAPGSRSSTAAPAASTGRRGSTRSSGW